MQKMKSVLPPSAQLPSTSASMRPFGASLGRPSMKLWWHLAKANPPWPVQGWLDITYLSPDGQFRLSRGNKGTLFVLVRDPSPRECLLQAIQGGRDDEVQQAIEVLQDKGSPISKPAKSSAVFGRWRLRWSKQVRPPHAQNTYHNVAR